MSTRTNNNTRYSTTTTNDPYYYYNNNATRFDRCDMRSRHGALSGPIHLSLVVHARQIVRLIFNVHFSHQSLVFLWHRRPMLLSLLTSVSKRAKCLKEIVIYCRPYQKRLGIAVCYVQVIQDTCVMLLTDVRVYLWQGSKGLVLCCCQRREQSFVIIALPDKLHSLSVHIGDHLLL